MGKLPAIMVHKRQPFILKVVLLYFSNKQKNSVLSFVRPPPSLFSFIILLTVFHCMAHFRGSPFPSLTKGRGFSSLNKGKEILWSNN